MINSPILDIAIGLVFIFLLYSLLATSIKETIATILGLRARMLKKGVIKGMLSDSKTPNKWVSILHGLGGAAREFMYFFTGRMPMKDSEKKLGDYFYDHPIIKNFGSTGLYPYPSYIPTSSFSTVLIDVLKKDFEKKKTAIAANKIATGLQADIAAVNRDLDNANDATKVNELLAYYARHYSATNPTTIDKDHLNIDEETLRILHLYFEKCVYNITGFGKQLELWFDESMDRVSGWYKRQAQYILFAIGFVMAFTFNVDLLEITKKLSVDKNVRDRIVANATQFESANKSQFITHASPSKTAGDTSAKIPTAAAGDAVTIDTVEAKAKIVSKRLLDADQDINSILALGWQFPAKDSSASPFKKIGEVFSSAEKSPRKLLGFLILAIAVSLGAPFWFDMLSKLINIRGAGKQESTNIGDIKAAAAATATPAQPVNVTINNQPGQEAAG